MNTKIFGKPGFCIRTDVDRPDPAVVSALARHQVAIIGDGIGRRAIMDAGIKPLNPQAVFAGPAITVEVPPADNLMIHAALKLAREGDVLVISAGGALSHGIFGELTTRMAIRKKLAAVVIDGAVRDSLELASCGLPIFARGVNPTGGAKDGPGQVNLQISCGGVVVNPGDIVVGDADGVIVVPLKQAADALTHADGRIAAEAKRMKAITEGPIDGIYPEWLIPTLREKGVFGPEDTI